MLTGTKTLLRTPVIADAQFMLEIENDERYWHLSNNTSPFALEDLEEFVRTSTFNLLHDLQLRLVITEISSKEKVGLIDIFEYDPTHKRAGTGVFICDAFRGRGLAADALRVLVRYLFDVVQLRQIWSHVLTTNEASMKLYLAAGFEVTGIKKQWVLHNNAYHDEAILQLMNPKC